MLRVSGVTAVVALIFVAGAGARARAAERVYVNDSSPSWSPDGRHILFAPWGGSWSPDGRKLAIIHRFDVWLMDSRGGNAHRLTRGFPLAYYDPDFSSDGTRLAFRSDRGVHVMRADGTDGRWTTFAGKRKVSPYAIFLVRPDGTSLRRLTHP